MVIGCLLVACVREAETGTSGIYLFKGKISSDFESWELLQLLCCVLTSARAPMCNDDSRVFADKEDPLSFFLFLGMATRS